MHEDNWLESKYRKRNIIFPRLDDPKLAEFIGILLGDGSIGMYNCKYKTKSKFQYRIQITLHSEYDKRYIKYVEGLIIRLFNTKPIIRRRKKEKAVDILIFSKDILLFLKDKVGVKLAPKWKRAVVPSRYIRNDLEIYVLRGYFDTDGSVVITNNNGILYPRLEMKISPSPMQEQIIDMIRRNGFRFGVYQIGKGKVRIQLNGLDQLNKWIEKIGFKNYRHIEKTENLVKEPN